MLKCHQITEQASRYIDGELTCSGRLQYRVHLLMCHHCRTFIHNFRAGIQMLRRVHQQREQTARIERICRRVQQRVEE